MTPAQYMKVYVWNTDLFLSGNHGSPGRGDGLELVAGCRGSVPQEGRFSSSRRIRSRGSEARPATSPEAWETLSSEGTRVVALERDGDIREGDIVLIRQIHSTEFMLREMDRYGESINARPDYAVINRYQYLPRHLF